jgi:hypothetical protein
VGDDVSRKCETCAAEGVAFYSVVSDKYPLAGRIVSWLCHACATTRGAVRRIR